ncbi:endolytic transglycosylase MltG [Photobacterium sp. NCIMB 13483]|uniref:Endolytic murein transglycosylase n=1 Tax=Photobacterium piscicola TaxID=1378299 RepID=A0A1T5I168_9GAMM|nr:MULTISPECIES: endolytic transglycosylase MltG [Photobacterium]MEC6822669.1 endolytic transglycosylase MltG [Photobacterium piscicola]MEC6882502.1 endolytic transglycosylase MltG [Photobacterium piscicola]MEC6898044.1 endolytic transglycosylase MltG [Photobacterium piscicola]PST93947.1 endolytic transglycosylase MltG [Photobacterium sp. NCIMB 13483]SKC32868.1 putative aminodeoxychorismate lyase [Photobacterium piscicola]
MLKKLITVIFILLLLIASAAGWGYFQVKSTLDKPVLTEQQTFITVKTGTSFRGLLTQLSNDKLITISPWLRWVGYLEPALTDIKAGTYAIKPQASLYSVLTMITEGKEYQYAITLVDGERFSEWRELLQADPHLAHTTDDMTQAQISAAVGIDNDKIEGYFLPNTYHFTAGTSDISILKRAHSAMMKELDLAWQQRASDLPLKTPYQALIMASIIEKETAVASERGLVASVFMNRLRANMPLQTDPTVIYGMGDKYNGNITKKDLRTPTAYNTYTMRGLPPTPIAMPSKASIMAAVDPDNSDFYYFVADGKGGHKFSTTLVEHNRAVRAYLKILRTQK